MQESQELFGKLSVKAVKEIGTKVLKEDIE